MTRGLAGCLAIVLACTPRTAEVPAAERPERAVAGSGVAISLERTPCYGACPTYTVSVSPSGAVTFVGRANVRRIGTATGKIPARRVAALLLELERAGYFTFADRYVVSEPVCRRYTTDSPTAISSATFRGRTKRIVHDYGCGGVPGALTLLEKRIDEVLGSDHWTGR
jgi:hypothetical protein